jgi:4'-phosphopantetheinyl transferase
LEIHPQHIKPNEVHIWVIPLDQGLSTGSVPYRYLSTEEVERADRFHFERHRRRFAISHNALREILAAYLGVNPANIEYDASSHGKPWLSGPYADSGIYFNLTHSHELALAAITREGELGVDVEYVKKFRDIDGIANRFFSPVEREAYQELEEDQRPQGFFNCWTRKEAFIKAIGEGLSHPLKQFDVTLTPGERASFLRIGDNPEEASKWTLEGFLPDPEYIGAVALRTREIHIQHFRFDEGGK